MNKSVTIDGGNSKHKITAVFTDPNTDDKINDHLMQIVEKSGAITVTLQNLQLDSAGQVKGLNIYEPGDRITLTTLQLNGSTGSGITIHGAEVAASDLDIANSGWSQSIDVGLGSQPAVSASTLTPTGSNNLKDLYQINTDNPGNVTVFASGYTAYNWYYWYDGMYDISQVHVDHEP